MRSKSENRFSLLIDSFWSPCSVFIDDFDPFLEDNKIIKRAKNKELSLWNVPRNCYPRGVERAYMSAWYPFRVGRPELHVGLTYDYYNVKEKKNGFYGNLINIAWSIEQDKLDIEKILEDFLRGAQEQSHRDKYTSLVLGPYRKDKK